MIVYLLQVVEAREPFREVLARFPAAGPAELDLIQGITDAVIADATPAIVEKGVGVFKTEAHVRAAIDAGLRESVFRAVHNVIADLKRSARPPSARE
jgi:hypothetical protein